MINPTLKRSYLFVLYLLFYLPIFVIVIFSFNNSAHSLLWHGFTWQWYVTLFQDSSILSPVLNSLLIGVLASTLAMALGGLAAITLYRYRFFGRKFIQLMLFILIIVPDLILAIAWLFSFLFLHLPLGFWSLLIAHMSFCMPFVFITVNGRIALLDKHLVEAARDLGAKASVIFFKILTPLLLPALLAGWLLSFTLSLDDVIISYFVTGTDFQILPLKIYAMVRLGINPEVNALCTILLGFTVLVVLVSQRMLSKKGIKDAHPTAA